MLCEVVVIEMQLGRQLETLILRHCVAAQEGAQSWMDLATNLMEADVKIPVPLDLHAPMDSYHIPEMAMIPHSDALALVVRDLKKKLRA